MDVLNLEYRKQVLEEIFGEENEARKNESFRRLEIYNDRHAPHVEAKLLKEFDAKTVATMRKITSINVTRKISEKKANVYQNAPTRTFLDGSGEPLKPELSDFLTDVYDLAKANTKLLRANRTKEFQNQVALQVVPANGVLEVRVLHPHQYDVITDPRNPEKAICYITSAYQRSVSGTDMQNQKIGDADDATKSKRSARRFVWWTDEHNFITDGNGELVGDDGDVENPIKALPFIDVSDEKDNEFWIRRGNTTVEFALEFAVMLSDTAQINRLQGYAQPIIKAIEKPQTLNVGPQNAIWLPLDPNSTVQPEFAFATPNSDLNASLAFLDHVLNVYMTSKGIDPKTIQSKGETRTFASGLERMLAMIEAFEASRDDVELFRWVESEVFSLVVKWLNVYVNMTNSPFRFPVMSVPDDAFVSVQFSTPELVQTKSEVENSELRLFEAGLRSAVQALMRIDDIDEAEAVKRLQDARKHMALLAKTPTEPTEGEAV